MTATLAELKAFQATIAEAAAARTYTLPPARPVGPLHPLRPA